MPIRPENRARYPKDWRQISDRIRFERAGSQCECDGRCCSPSHASMITSYRCQAEHLERHPITGSTVVLTVAHLDHTPENCADDNLLAMCQACHLAYDRDHHAETRAAARAASQQSEVLF